MSKHTPGPWTLVHNSWEYSSVYGADGSTVARCSIDAGVTEETQEEWESVKDANARLIAAAPDLLGALQLLLGNVTHLLHPLDTNPKDKLEDVAVIEQARAAIAKATQCDS